jgi:hypothetical protein
MAAGTWANRPRDFTIFISGVLDFWCPSCKVYHPFALANGPAAVAELADAQASGACLLREVEVRLLSAASFSGALFRQGLFFARISG